MAFPYSLDIPRQVLTIAETLQAAGFDTWCVGGAIRDNLLGLENKDFDLTTAARPEDVQRLFKRTIPIGVDHGTVAVLDQHRKPHEVTTFRRDVTTDGRHATVEFGVSLDEDLARRDFTINAIAHHPLTHEWRDPFDGAGDLERKLIRAVGDPTERFREDYLRILRALRFAARFGFEIDPPTWDAATASAGGLAQLSAERVRDEWFKGLESAQRPSELVVLWEKVGAMGIWLPELERGARDAEPGGLDVVDRLRPADPVLITAYLSSAPGQTLERLRCSNAEIERGTIIGRHVDAWPDPENGVGVRHWLSTVGPVADDLVKLSEARGRPLAEAVRRERESGAALEIGQLAVTGTDLMRAGLPEGPEVGQLLRRLLDAVLVDPALNTKQALLTTVAGWIEERPAPRAPDAANESHTAPRAPRPAEQGGGEGP
jgi:hypothetical protein